MREADFKVVDSVVEFHSDDSIGCAVILQYILRVLLHDIDVVGQTRVVVLHHGHCVLVLCDNLLDLLARNHCLGANPLTHLNMLEECLVAFLFSTAGAGEHDQLEDFLDASVHLGRRLSAPAVLNGARPAALHSHAVFAVEAIAARALKWEG